MPASRRDFLAASASATLQTPPRVRIGFLGVSHSHARDKVRVVRESAHFDLAGVWDRNPGILAEYRKSGVPVLSRDQLLGDAAITALAIESEVKDHAEDALAALRAGKHIHVEKPPASDVPSVKQMVDLAGQKKLLFQTGYMWRYNPAVVKALEAARAGWLGQVYLVRANMNTIIDASLRKDWNLFPGGQMFEQGSHLVDICVRLMGRPNRITPFLRSDGPYADGMKDNTAAILEWPKAMGIITAATLQPNAPAHRFLEILGTRGTAVVRPIEPPSLLLDLAEAAGPYPKGRTSPAMPAYSRYVGDFEELGSSLRLGKPLEVSLDTEVAIQEVVLTASAMMGR